MAFDIFPDPATAALLGKPAFAPLELVSGERMAAFAPLTARVGDDPAQPGLPTTFLRIAISNASAAAATPALELSAADPIAAPASIRVVDPTTANSLGSAQPLFDAPGITSAALAYFAGAARNVFLIKIVIEKPGTQLWLRLSNANASACKYVWVVADSEADSAQPWINLAGPHGPGANVPVVVDAYAGQPSALNAVGLTLQNFGAGPATVAGFSPPLPAPFAVRGLPLTLAPNQTSQGEAALGVDAPTAGPRAPGVFRLTTRDKSDPGPFGPLHNDGVTLSANVAVNNVWAPRANMMMGRMSLAAAADAKGATIYAFGGVAVDRHPVQMIERFDVSGNLWTNAGVMQVRSSIAVALGRDGLIYAAGTRTIPDIGVVGVFEVYNPTTGEWRDLATMPATRIGVALAAGADGLIYAIGGRTVVHQHGPSHVFVHGPLVGSVDAYDPATNSWSSRDPMPTQREFHAAASPDGRVIYAAGGFGDAGILPTVEAFDLASGAWTTRAPMAAARANFGFAASRNGKLYAAGGWDGGGNQIPQVEEFDPATGGWRPRANLTFPRGGLALAGDASGRLYAIGGESRNFEVVEVLTP